MDSADAEVDKFEFVAGWLCLDFVNTLSERPSDHPVEGLGDYRDLVRWGVESEALTRQQAEGLGHTSDTQSQDAIQALRKAVHLRETIFRIFFALTEDETPDELDLTALHSAMVDSVAHSQLVKQPERFILDWADDPDALDRVIWAVAQSAVNLLTSGVLDRVKKCGEDDCKWVFLDTSRNGRRRWCDMKTCGNRAKARAHYQRQKAASDR
jgi:predicted RNA-binding Zn ribbon-like protein